MAGKVGGRRKARAAHPLVVAALPQLLVVPRAAQERRQLGELRVAAAVLEVLVRDAQPLHQLDEVKGLHAEPDVLVDHRDLKARPDLDLLDGLEERVDGVDEGAVDDGIDEGEQRHGHLVEDHPHDVGRRALLQLVGQVVDPRGAQQHEHLRNCRRVQWVRQGHSVAGEQHARGAPGTRTPSG